MNWQEGKEEMIDKYIMSIIQRMEIIILLLMIATILFMVGAMIYQKIRYGTVELSSNGIGVLICCGIALFLSVLMIALN